MIAAIAILSLGAVNALIPIVIVLVLVVAAAGLNRGYSLFNFLGLSTFAGINPGGKGSLAGKSAFSVLLLSSPLGSKLGLGKRLRARYKRSKFARKRALSKENRRMAKQSVKELRKGTFVEKNNAVQINKGNGTEKQKSQSILTRKVSDLLMKNSVATRLGLGATALKTRGISKFENVSRPKFTRAARESTVRERTIKNEGMLSKLKGSKKAKSVSALKQLAFFGAPAAFIGARITKKGIERHEKNKKASKEIIKEYESDKKSGGNISSIVDRYKKIQEDQGKLTRDQRTAMKNEMFSELQSKSKIAEKQQAKHNIATATILGSARVISEAARGASGKAAGLENESGFSGAYKAASAHLKRSMSEMGTKETSVDPARLGRVAWNMIGIGALSIKKGSSLSPDDIKSSSRRDMFLHAQYTKVKNEKDPEKLNQYLQNINKTEEHFERLAYSADKAAQIEATKPAQNAERENLYKYIAAANNLKAEILKNRNTSKSDRSNIVSEFFDRIPEKESQNKALKEDKENLEKAYSKATNDKEREMLEKQIEEKKLLININESEIKADTSAILSIAPTENISGINHEKLYNFYKGGKSALDLDAERKEALIQYSAAKDDKPQKIALNLISDVSKIAENNASGERELRKQAVRALEINVNSEDRDISTASKLGLINSGLDLNRFSMDDNKEVRTAACKALGLKIDPRTKMPI